MWKKGKERETREVGEMREVQVDVSCSRRDKGCGEVVRELVKWGGRDKTPPTVLSC